MHYLLFYEKTVHNNKTTYELYMYEQFIMSIHLHMCNSFFTVDGARVKRGTVWVMVIYVSLLFGP